MYWPPAGGPGVQRPLRLARHLVELGFEVHVLAPDDPKWLHRDASLVSPGGVTVHRARNLGPRARRPAEELRAAQGIDRAALRAGLLARGLLVPDASVLWNLTAMRAATGIVRTHRVDAVLTTSPPGSVHLVGWAAKRATGVRWVADLRDSLVSFAHRRRDIRGERSLARLVASRADAVVAASAAIAAEMRPLAGAKVTVIGNGCDFEDFEGLPYRPGERFRITHTGSFFGRRDPRPFLEALASADAAVLARFVGDFRSTDRAFGESLGLGDRLELLPYLPHADALALQRDSDALLLLIPEAGGRGRGVLSGKVFEYLAAERPILAAVPPDGEAAALLRETGAGLVVPSADVTAIGGALADLVARWRAGNLNGSPLSSELKARLSRRARAEELVEVLARLERHGRPADRESAER
jgi:glycosyltransferase involved in cell wall biosynthesis